MAPVHSRGPGALSWLAVLAVSSALAAAGEPCQADRLAVYRVVLHTFWSRDRFPKHYPDWRPPAQWSQLVGRSHDKSSVLFRLGTRASRAVKELAETGRTSALESHGQGEAGVLDEFKAPPISTGVGRTQTQFFVDGNHSSVSLMSRITPSPDWFIGIDSFDLCVNGNWLDSITIEVDPLDAGTDNGFTFTAPNWPTEPQGIVYRVTSHYPSHPASSFYYPVVKFLPPIGTFQFIKLKEYGLSEVFHHSEDDRKYDVLEMERAGSRTNNVAPRGNSDIEKEIEEERREQEAATAAATSTANPPSTTLAIPRGDKDALLNSIVETFRTSSVAQEHHRKKHRGGPLKHTRKMRPPRDCRVGVWSHWAACSQSCGIGETQRRREVLRPARRGGKACPPLLETKWCGSAHNCPRDHPDW